MNPYLQRCCPSLLPFRPRQGHGYKGGEALRHTVVDLVSDVAAELLAEAFLVPGLELKPEGIDGNAEQQNSDDSIAKRHHLLLVRVTSMRKKNPRPLNLNVTEREQERGVKK